jgi:hypothetical protein
MNGKNDGKLPSQRAKICVISLFFMHE